MYTVNVSSIQDFMQCRYRWVCRWVLNRVPLYESDALTFGKAFHKLFEYAALDTMEGAFKKLYDELDVEMGSEFRSIEEVLLQWKDIYEFDDPCIDVEQPFTVQSPFDAAINFRGRPDRIAKLYGSLVHVQNRSLAPNTNFVTYSRLAKRHLHELLYAYARNLSGTVFNLYRKVKYRGTPTKACPEGRILRPINEILWQGLVTYSKEEVMAGMATATSWAKEMQHVEWMYREFGKMPLANDKLNGGWLGNTIDPYFLVLTGEAKLSDNKLFKDRVDTYADTPKLV